MSGHDYLKCILTGGGGVLVLHWGGLTLAAHTQTHTHTLTFDLAESLVGESAGGQRTEGHVRCFYTDFDDEVQHVKMNQGENEKKGRMEQC